MINHPEDYHWSSFAFNALGKDNALLTPHPLYDALGTNMTERRITYRTLFEHQVPERTFEAIRDATNKAWVLGSSRFQDEVERLLLRQAKPKSRGSDRRSDKVKKQRINRV